MNAAILIPARGGSKGIPKKNLMNFCGLPLIAWSIKQGQEAGLPVYVSTDDDDIKMCALEFGAQVIDRPAEFATDTSPTIDTVKHFSKHNHDYNYIVLLQPTNPLRKCNDIWCAVKSMSYTMSVFLYSVIEKRLIIRERNCVVEPNKPRQHLGNLTIEHGLIYIYKTNPVYECFDNLKCFQYITPEWQSHEIDELEDVEICEFYMRKKILCR